MTPFTFLKPLIPRRLQILIRRMLIKKYLPAYNAVWPIDPKCSTLPKGWAGWPDGKKFALILTHDVDTQRGHDNCFLLASIEEKLGFRSVFNFVAEDYQISTEMLKSLKAKGFEIGQHGIHHINHFTSEIEFEKYASKINRYLNEWDAVGFRSPSMYHNLEMIHKLKIEYDASTFDTDPFEPQPSGMGTIFPFLVSSDSTFGEYVEMPYTLPQDFLLFILLRRKDLDIWKMKLKWVADQGGMVLFITHPDYMNFNNAPHYEKYPVSYYEEFLNFIKTKYEGQYWHALPRDLARLWKKQYGNR